MKHHANSVRDEHAQHEDAERLSPQGAGAVGNAETPEFLKGLREGIEKAAAQCRWFAEVQMPPHTAYNEGRHDAAQALEAHIRSLNQGERA